MGDTSQASGTPLSRGSEDVFESEPAKGQSAARISSSDSYPSTGRHGASSPFHTQLSSIPTQQHVTDGQRGQSQTNIPAYGPALGQQSGQLAFDMGGMSGALPDYSMTSPSGQAPKSQHQQQMQRGLSGSTTSAGFQMQQGLPYTGPAAPGFPAAGVYGPYGQTHFSNNYMPQGAPQQPIYGAFNPVQPRINTMPPPMAGYQQVPSAYYYIPGTLPAGIPGGYNGQASQSPHNNPFVTGYGQRGSFQGDQAGIRRQSSSDSSLSAIPRGPPRKPKQSGHALWVGNLPPGATVLDLKDHFSRDATRDIESLFLISKSNCAFVNYRTEAACAAAMQRFHDSRFQGVRLVCRLRRGSSTTPGAPAGPSLTPSGRRSSQPSSSASPLDDTTETDDVDSVTSPPEPTADSLDTSATGQLTGSGSQRAAEKFFIIKSLTLQDLEQSVRNGIWATQSHNEEVLNKAYESADNVYLIFSANKSGEYFGYARMISPIGDDVTEIFSSIPPVQSVESINAPRTIMTPATDTAPKGRIIDDSARGTIFWEAEFSDDEEVEEELPVPVTEELPEDAGGSGPNPQAYGKPFKVEWQSTNRLAFYRTRGLRNPWNANRDVKIARDGTELEPTVGRKLVQMFHRAAPSPLSPGTGILQMPTYLGGPPMGQPSFGPQ